MTAATCPRCKEAVTVPSGVLSETRVACPLCQEELTGKDFIGQLPPALVLLDAPAAVEIETQAISDRTDTFDSDNPFGDVREAKGGAGVVTRVAQTHLQGRRASSDEKRGKGSARQIISIVLGGMLALPIAQLILWKLDRDPVNLADKFQNVRWMHWAMPKHKKARWPGIQEEEEEDNEGKDTSTSGLPGIQEEEEEDNEGKDTSTSGLKTSPGTPQVESSRVGDNLPDRREIVDLNDLERGTGNSQPARLPGASVPEPEPVDEPGWISDAPVFGAMILQPMLNQTRMAIKEWEDQPDELEAAERRRLDEGFYAMLAQLGLGITFADEADPEAQALVNETAQLLTSFRGNEKKLRLITEYGLFKYNLSQEGLRGIALFGTITAIEKKDPYFEVTLRVETEDESTDLVVISRGDPRELPVRPISQLKPGQQVLILGTALLDPSGNINGYQGDAEQLVIGGYPVVIKQPDSE